VLNELLEGIAKQGPNITLQDLAIFLDDASAAFARNLFVAALRIAVWRDLSKLLGEEIQPLWPAAFEGGSNAGSLVLAPHVQVNFEGSDRYTLSLPISTAYRISPLDDSVENMTIAGDWTACGLDVGCIEAAVMSGMLAAYAISGQPDPETAIIGYDHP